MTIKRRGYGGAADFDTVGNFLTRHYRPGNRDGNWLQPIWEYAYTHPMLDESSLGKIGIWEDRRQVVGVATYESRLGEAFFNTHPDYGHLKPEMLTYAEAYLAGTGEDGRRYLRPYVNDFDTPFEQVVASRGYRKDPIRSSVHQWHKEFVAESLDIERQVDMALTLFREKHTEEKLAGTILLQEILLPADAVKCERDLDRFAELFTARCIYDWNVCDWFCVKVLGPLIQKEGVRCALQIAGWRDAENLWQARASLVAFVNLAGNSDYYPMIELSCQAIIRREERFAKTAVGWILRSISKHNQQFARRFLDKNVGYFSVESLKNAVKYFGEEEKRSYLRMKSDA